MRTDTVEGGKNKIRGEGLHDVNLVGHCEPWTLGLEKTPLYVSTDKELVQKLVDLRRQHASEILRETAKHLIEKAKIQKKSAARAMISVYNAIDEEAETPEIAKQLKDDSESSIEKIVARETEREMRSFNDRATVLASKPIPDHDIIDISSTVVKVQNKSAMANTAPFREQPPNYGGRPRGRGGRRGYHPYPPRAMRGGYQ